MLDRLRRLLAAPAPGMERNHRCVLPKPPVTEDQRYWTCPACGCRWGWYSIDNGLGRLVDLWMPADEQIP